MSRRPTAATQVGEKIAVIEEISAEDFGYAQDEMPVRNCLDHFLAEPFTEFNDPLLMARWY